MFRFFKKKAPPAPPASSPAPDALPVTDSSAPPVDTRPPAPDVAAAPAPSPSAGTPSVAAEPAGRAEPFVPDPGAMPSDRVVAPSQVDPRDAVVPSAFTELDASTQRASAPSFVPDSTPEHADVEGERQDAAHPVLPTVGDTPASAHAVAESGAPALVPPAVPMPSPGAPALAQTVTVAPPVGVTPAAQPVPEPDPVQKKGSWLARLKQGLSRTGQSIGNLFVNVPVDENLFEELESALIMADAGVEATEKLLTALRAKVKKERLDDAAKVKLALKSLLADHLRPLEKTFHIDRAHPLVVMIAGVNGAGKTTSIGKLAFTFQQQGASVLLAAGDTFRAAAREQLVEWGRRNNVTVISQDGGDPAAVAFDAVNAGRARKAGVVMVDTAGRLPTQLHLMEELKKIKRVIGKADGQAPHEVLLVIDGNTGQNAIAQIRAFDAAITLTGLVVTKLDGTAKGGTLAAVAAGSQGVRPIPVYWIGVGEGLQDLQPFVADEFAQALLGD